MKLILASASPQRKKLLKKIGIPFSVVPSHVREIDPKRVHYKDAQRLVMRLAAKKAQAVAQTQQLKRKDCVILGADTLVVCDGEILGKPKNEADARGMLRKLSGRWQRVLTGVCLIYGRKKKISFEQTRLRFAMLDEKTIIRLAKKNLDKAGSYAIQRINDRFIKEIKGDMDNVIGLPVRKVKKMLELMLTNRAAGGCS